MNSPTLVSFTAFVAWALALLVVMETIRSKMVLARQVAANDFVPDNANLSPFMQRLARAHANCLEGIPIFGGLMLVALVSERQSVTDPLAYVLLFARILQSTIHLISVNPIAVTLRFLAFAVQMGIAVHWSYRLLAG